MHAFATKGWGLFTALLWCMAVAGQNGNNSYYHGLDDGESYYQNNRPTQRQATQAYRQRSVQRGVVAVCPPAPREAYIQQRRPSPVHVWVPGEYRWRGGRYVYVPGCWMIPPRKGVRYIPGYWQPARGGFVWIAGGWGGHSVQIRW